MAALVLVVYVTLLRDDSDSAPAGIQAPGGQQVQNGPDGGEAGTARVTAARKARTGGGGRADDGNGSPGLEGPAGTGTMIVGGPGWMGSFPARRRDAVHGHADDAADRPVRATPSASCSARSATDGLDGTTSSKRPLTRMVSGFTQVN